MPRLRSTLVILAIFVCLSQACTTPEPPKPDPPPTPTPTSLSAKMTGEPAFDAQLLKAVQNNANIRELRLYLKADGTARKTSVYHEDASAVPEAVKKAVQERYPDATVRYYEYERYDDGRYVHEVELKGADGTEMEVSLYPDGQLKYAEKPMAIDALPQKVRDTVQSKVPGGTIDEVEVKEGPEMYQLHVRVKTSGNGDHYLTFTRDHTMMHHQIRYPAFIEVPAP